MGELKDDEEDLEEFELLESLIPLGGLPGDPDCGLARHGPPTQSTAEASSDRDDGDSKAAAEESMDTTGAGESGVDSDEDEDENSDGGESEEEDEEEDEDGPEENDGGGGESEYEKLRRERMAQNQVKRGFVPKVFVARAWSRKQEETSGGFSPSMLSFSRDATQRLTSMRRYHDNHTTARFWLTFPWQAFLANLGFNESQRTLPAEAAQRRRAYAATRRPQKPREREPAAPMRRSSRNEGKEHVTYDADALFRQLSREEREREVQEVTIELSADTRSTITCFCLHFTSSMHELNEFFSILLLYVCRVVSPSTSRPAAPSHRASARAEEHEQGPARAVAAGAASRQAKGQAPPTQQRAALREWAIPARAALAPGARCGRPRRQRAGGLGAPCRGGRYCIRATPGGAPPRQWQRQQR